MSSYKNIVAEAMVEETFEQEFGIWDLSQFLGIITLFEQPELEFHDKYMEISNEAGSSVKYFYCEPKLITSLPPKALNMPAAVLQFPLTEKKLQELQKASSVLQVSTCRSMLRMEKSLLRSATARTIRPIAIQSALVLLKTA